MMAHMSVDGLDALIGGLDALTRIPDSTLDGMLEAGAEVLVQAQRAEIGRQWSGPHSLGISAKSVKKDRPQKSWYGRSIAVYPQGTRKRGRKQVRNAEIAFINEYGAPKRGIAARPAIYTANEKAADEAAEAGEKVYHAYLDSKEL